MSFVEYTDGLQLLTLDRSQAAYGKLSTKNKVMESLGIGFSCYSLEQRIENRRRWPTLLVYHLKFPADGQQS